MASPPKNLPILLGALRQEAGEGELALEQNDGRRWLYLSKGELVHLKSDAAGEQFGNYLLRQGILDFPALSQLLANDENYRLGEKVIQWGMMNLPERDRHLQTLQEQIMIHALEHPIIRWTWNPGPSEGKLAQDLHFKLQHRHFIWKSFQESNYLMDLLSILQTEEDWRWEGKPDLLGSLSDLPLTPETAYALSFLSADPISFETFCSLSHLEAEDAGRFIAILWALGGLRLTGGKLPSITAPAPPAAPPAPAVPAEPRPKLLVSPAQLPVPGPTPLPPLPLPPMATPQPAPRPAAAPPQPTLPPVQWQAPLSLPPLEWQKPHEANQVAGLPEFLEWEPEEPARVPDPAVPPEPELDGPARARKLVRRARHQAQQERTVEAIRSLEQAVQLEPDADPAYEAWLTLGQLRMANPAWSNRSIEALQNASRLRPAEAQPWATMGEVYLRKGFQANAVACFRKALELNPSVPVPPGVDLQAREPDPAQPVPNTGIFSKFRSILGRQDKP